MKKAKSLKDFEDALLGWKENKKTFTIIFDKNVAKAFCHIMGHIRFLSHYKEKLEK